MPASSSETVSHIEESLKSSLSKGDSLDTKLVCSSKKILLHKIDFRPAERQSSFQLEQLRTKYTPLNSSDKSSDVEESKPHGQSLSGTLVTFERFVLYVFKRFYCCIVYTPNISLHTGPKDNILKCERLISSKLLHVLQE